MESTLSDRSHIGLGFASHPDAFQCGREAAQVAKNQLPEGPVNLVFVFGPQAVGFKDFVEGVRLVMGEDALIAIPSERVFTTESHLTHMYFVAAIQTPQMRISITADDFKNKNAFSTTTSLLTQFRRLRGNAFREFIHHGDLVFIHNPTTKHDAFVSAWSADVGLENWLIGATTLAKANVPVTCTSRTLDQGIIAIEFLSTHPIGIGSVPIGSFLTQADVYREALKTALRDATSQMGSHPACFGLVFFDLSNETSIPIPDDILKNASSALARVPLLGISTRQHFSRRANRANPTENDSILVMLIPE